MLKGVEVKLHQVRIPGLVASVLGQGRVDEEVRHPEDGLEMSELGEDTVVGFTNGHVAANLARVVVTRKTLVSNQDVANGGPCRGHR